MVPMLVILVQFMVFRFLNNPLASIEEAIGFRRKDLMTPSTIVECFHNLRKAYKIPNELNALQYYRLVTLSSL